MNTSEFETTRLLEVTAETPHLTDREKHLVGLAVTATRGCVFCTGGRLRKALEAGIPYESVRATIDLTAAVNAGVTLRTALLAATGLDAPAACDGNECTVGLNGGSG